MTDAICRLLLWLYILNLWIAFVAGLYEHRIVVARWLFANADGTRHWDGHARGATTPACGFGRSSRPDR